VTGRRPVDGRDRVNGPAPGRATADTDPDPRIGGSTDPASSDPVLPVHQVRGGIAPLKAVRRPTADATGRQAPTSGDRSSGARPGRARPALDHRVRDRRARDRRARRIAHGRTARATTDRGSGAGVTTDHGRTARETIGRGAGPRTDRVTIDHRATARRDRDRRSSGARSDSLRGRSGRRRCPRPRSLAPRKSS
jgi:hypothetical protein